MGAYIQENNNPKKRFLSFSNSRKLSTFSSKKKVISNFSNPHFLSLREKKFISPSLSLGLRGGMISKCNKFSTNVSTINIIRGSSLPKVLLLTELFKGL